MASTYSDLKLELIGTGEQSGQWGNTTNTNLGTAVEEAIVGSADVAFSSSDVTLTLTNTNASQAARHVRLNLTGTSGGARQLILGSGCQIDKPYIVNNGLADAVTVKNTTGTGVTIPAGKTMWVFNDGTNVVDVVTAAGSFAIAGAVSAGGTGTIGGNTTIGGTLGVTGATTLSSTLGVTGNTTVGGTFGATGNATLGGTLTIASTATMNGATVFNTRALEKVTVSATAATGTVNYDAITQTVLYYTSNATGNWTVNVRGNSGTALSSILSAGQSVTVVFIVTQGATAYYQSAFQIDGASVTPEWLGGSPPLGGNANSLDVYVYNIIRTAGGYTVLASITRFA
jgi:hypothetical protein